MNIRYDRDGSHNYLVSDAENIDFSSYEYNMLDSNDVEGILPFSLRRIDGRSYLYYEIDSMQSLKNRYGQGKLSYEKLKALSGALVRTLERLSGYFLDEDKLVLESECIFEGLSSGKFFFLYFPDHEKKKSFGEMVMDLIDTEDEKAVELAYRISDKTLDENVNLTVVLRKILIDEGENENKQPVIEPDNINAVIEADNDEDFDEEEETEKRVVKIHIPSKVSILLSILFAIVAGALWYIRVMYYLTLEEDIIDLAVLMLCVMMSLISLLVSGKGKKNKPAGEKKPFKLRGRKLGEKKDENFEDDEDAEGEEEENKGYVVPEISGSFGYADESDCEETVLLGHESRALLHKLYSTNKELSNNIELENLPLTIGKHVDYSEAVLRDPTVSRLHARILSEDGDMLIQDLNSKNGTFVNGRRLLPNEKMVIIPDDEIAFGKCSFQYR